MDRNLIHQGLTASRSRSSSLSATTRRRKAAAATAMVRDLPRSFRDEFKKKQQSNNEEKRKDVMFTGYQLHGARSSAGAGAGAGASATISTSFHQVVSARKLCTKKSSFESFLCWPSTTATPAADAAVAYVGRGKGRWKKKKGQEHHQSSKNHIQQDEALRRSKGIIEQKQKHLRKLIGEKKNTNRMPIYKENRGNVQGEENYTLHESEYTKPFRHELDVRSYPDIAECDEAFEAIEAIENSMYEFICGMEPSTIDRKIRSRLVDGEVIPPVDITLFLPSHEEELGPEESKEKKLKKVRGLQRSASYGSMINF